VIERRVRHTLRRAIAVGLGGACATSCTRPLGILGVTPVLRSYAIVSPILYAVSGIVLMVYGFLTARSSRVRRPPRGAVPDAQENELVLGFKTGLLLILLNPAAGRDLGRDHRADRRSPGQPFEADRAPVRDRGDVWQLRVVLPGGPPSPSAARTCSATRPPGSRA